MGLEHIHMIGTAKVSKPPMTAAEGEKWLRELVEKVGMEILIGPHAVYCDLKGNEGVTGIVCLSTSHASFHSWSEVDEPFINFDIYSCRHFDAATVVEHLSVFEPTKIDYVILDRSGGQPVESERGEINP